MFLFDDKIGTNYRDQAKISKISSIICDLDLDELIKLDVKYLFSTVKIDNAEQICLRKISYKVEANDYYNLFVYELLGGYHEQ